jgi:DNA-binding transcriptional LysR family regulator
MEIRQLRSFLAIADTLHFSRTAELVHISQPALSLQIKALEEEVGARLLERNRRRTTLTAAGIAFRGAAAAALNQLDQAIRNARMAAKGKVGLLRIGFISTAGKEVVPNVVRQFRDENPESHGESAANAADRIARHRIPSSADRRTVVFRSDDGPSRSIRARTALDASTRKKKESAAPRRLGRELRDV